MPGIFGTYAIEVEYLFIWYPLKSGVHLSEPRITGGSILHKNTDPTFDINTHQVRSVEPFTTGAVEEASKNVVAFVDVSVLQDSVFQVELQVQIGRVRRTKHFVAPPDSRIPFLINALALADNDSFSRDTGVAFQGVITTGHQLGLSDVIASIVTKVFSP